MYLYPLTQAAEAVLTVWNLPLILVDRFLSSADGLALLALLCNAAAKQDATLYRYGAGGGSRHRLTPLRSLQSG